MSASIAPPSRFVEYGPRRPRFRVGMAFVAVAVMLQVVVAAIVISRVGDTVTSGHIVTMPGSAVIACHIGDEWRLGPQTGTTSQVGPVTVTDGFSAELGEVKVVTASGREVVPVVFGGSTSETFSFGGLTFAAVATFTCPTDERATVTFTGPAGAAGAVFPSIRALFGGLVPVLVLLGVSVLVGIVGMVLAITGRRRPLPIAPPPMPSWPAPPSR